MESSLNNIKQPRPSVKNNKKLLNRPQVGVVDVPKFSKTPEIGGGANGHVRKRKESTLGGITLLDFNHHLHHHL